MLSFSQLHCSCPATSLLIEHIPPCSCSALHVAQKEYSQGLAQLRRALLDSLIRGRLRDISLASGMHSHANSHLSYLNKWSLSCPNPWIENHSVVLDLIPLFIIFSVSDHSGSLSNWIWSNGRLFFPLVLYYSKETGWDFCMLRSQLPTRQVSWKKILQIAMLYESNL